MRRVAAILLAYLVMGCALLPDGEVYVTDESIHSDDNSTVTSDQQQLAYWRSYGF